MKDQQTEQYFDQFTPHFDPKRFLFALDYITEHFEEGQRLLDIGCGDGATLHMIKTNTQLSNVCGLEVSNNYASKARELVGCEVVIGDILDRDTLQGLAGQFDYCTLGSVLHHLVGKTRRESMHYADVCIRNSMDLLKPGGSLIIFEPAHSPSALMDLVFWIKRMVGSVTNGRLELLKEWVNFGLPVVSYYTPEQLLDLIDDVDGASVTVNQVVDKRRMGWVIKRTSMGLVVKKAQD